MKKTYENPMLQVVSINKKDIIATSLGIFGDVYGTTGGNSTDGYGFAPGQRGLDDWDAGY